MGCCLMNNNYILVFLRMNGDTSLTTRAINIARCALVRISMQASILGVQSNSAVFQDKAWNARITFLLGLIEHWVVVAEPQKLLE